MTQTKELTTLVIGASLNPERYSNKAINMLSENGFKTIAFGKRKGEVAGITIETEFPLNKPIDTVTLYLGPKNQESDLIKNLSNLNPRRVIFNPGTENLPLINLLRSKGIKIEIACTLVMLRTGQY